MILLFKLPKCSHLSYFKILVGKCNMATPNHSYNMINIGINYTFNIHQHTKYNHYQFHKNLKDMSIKAELLEPYILSIQLSHMFNNSINKKDIHISQLFHRTNIYKMELDLFEGLSKSNIH